jgi:lysophospholipase L1-like esterase
MPKKKSKFIQNFILLIVTIIICIVFLEVVLRVVFPNNTSNVYKDFYVLDNNTGYLPGANIENFIDKHLEYEVTINTNSLGLRDQVYQKKEVGEKKILVLGDSFTFGQGVELEESFPRILESKLNSEGGDDDDDESKYQVINAGVGGWDQSHELNFLKAYGWDLQPDMIIVAYFIGNDIGTYTGNYQIEDGYLIKGKGTKKSLRSRTRKWLRLNSALYRIIKQISQDNVLLAKIAAKTGFVDPFNVELKQFRKEYDLEVKKAWAETFTEIAGIIEEVDKNEKDIPLYFVLIPMRRQVQTEEWENVKEVYALNEEDYDLLKPNKMIKEFLEKRGILMIDLTPELNSKYSAKSNEKLYFSDDGHLNNKGHYYAGNIIYDALEH